MNTFLRSFFCFLVILLGPFAYFQQNGWPLHRKLPPSSFSEHGGYSYLVTVPLYPFTDRAVDTMEHGQQSDLRLFDGDRELGPNHIPQVKVASDGTGAFDDWDGALVVSLFDNADPRRSGRNITAFYRAFPSRDAPIALLAFSLLAAFFISGVVSVSRLWSRREHLSTAQRRAVFTSLIACGAVLAAVALHLQGVRIDGQLSQDAISSWGGDAYDADLPLKVPLMVTRGDDNPKGSASDLRVKEDGRLIGPAHSMHDDIRRKGAGAYSHWMNGIVFSASDSSDPRTNGRMYRVSYRIFLASRATWVIAGLGVGIILFELYRMARPHVTIPQFSFRRRPAAFGAVAKLPLSVWGLAGYVICYALALSLIYNSLNARAHDAGGLKINFEYKVF